MHPLSTTEHTPHSHHTRHLTRATQPHPASYTQHHAPLPAFSNISASTRLSRRSTLHSQHQRREAFRQHRSSASTTTSNSSRTQGQPPWAAPGSRIPTTPYSCQLYQARCRISAARKVVNVVRYFLDLSLVKTLVRQQAHTQHGLHGHLLDAGLFLSRVQLAPAIGLDLQLHTATSTSGTSCWACRTSNRTTWTRTKRSLRSWRLDNRIQSLA